METGSSSSGATVVDAALPTFCETQQAPIGVTDFVCADFDGPTLAPGFTTVFPSPSDAGPPPALSVSTEEYVSSPHSLLTLPPPGDAAGNRGSVLELVRAGATRPTEMQLVFSLNRSVRSGVVPPKTGRVYLAQMGTPETTLRLAYADGAAVGTVVNYTGYFLDVIDTGGAARRMALPIQTSPSDGVWTRIALRYSEDGAVEVRYNDVEVLQSTAYPYSGTSVTLRIGAYANGATANPHRYRMDNVVFGVKRGP